MSSAETDVEGSSSLEYNSSSDVEPSDSDGDSKAVADPEVNQTDLPTTPPYSLTPVTDGFQKKNEYNLACKLTESTISKAQNLGRTGSSGSNLQNYTLGNSSRSAVNPADCIMPMTSNFRSPVPYPQIPLTHRWPIPMIAPWDCPRFYDNLALHNNVAAENIAVAGYSGSGLPYYPQSNSPVNVLPQPVSYGDYSGGQAASEPVVNSADSGIQPTHILTTPHHLTQMPGSQNQMMGGQPHRILSDNFALHNNVAAENIAVARHSGSGLPYYPQSNSLVNVLPQPVSYGDYSGGQAASGPAVNSADSGIQPSHILTTPHHLTQMPGSQNQMIGGQPNRILSESNMLPTQNLGHTGSLASSHSNFTQGHSSKAALNQPKKGRPAGLQNGGKRRTFYTTSQLEILEKAFQEDSYPFEWEKIAEKVGTEVHRVQNWFCYRRRRAKRIHRKRNEAMRDTRSTV